MPIKSPIPAGCRGATITRKGRGSCSSRHRADARSDAVTRRGAAAVVRRRRRALRRVGVRARRSTAICARAELQSSDAVPLASRFEADGLAGLVDRERPGDRIDLAPELERLILVVRMLSYWNSRRIAAGFGRRGIEISHGQVDRLLARRHQSGPAWRGCPVRATSGRAPTSYGTSTSRARSTSGRPRRSAADLSLRRPGRRLQPLPARHPGGTDEGGRARPGGPGRGDRAVRHRRSR